MVAYFYRELNFIQLKEVKVDVINPQAAKRQSSIFGFPWFRNDCVKRFVEILGLNPLKTVLIKDPDVKDIRTEDPLMKRMIYQKRKMYEKLLVKGVSAKKFASSKCDQCARDYERLLNQN